MLTNYVLTPDSVFKSVPPKIQNQLDKPVCFTHANILLSYVNELCICLKICLSSRFMSIVLWPRMTHPAPMLSQNACCGWGAWCNSQTLLHKSTERSSLISGPGLNSSPLEARNPSIVHTLIAATFYKKAHKHLWELSFFSQLTSILFVFL